MKKLLLALSLALQAAALAAAEPSPVRPEGVAVKDYPWLALPGETNEALERKGDRKRGERLYALCRSCHLSSAGGSSDGSVPQLAGQHSTVLIKQMADIRSGARHNATMYPFAAVLADPQDLADLAAYLEGLCIPREHGQYDAPDAAQQLAKGKALYERECSACHGPRGEGARYKFHPVIAGQHHAYLLRQMTDIRDGKRPNVNPEMLSVISRYDDEQLLAISAYQSSLVMPGRMCSARPPARKQ
ncbi:MAG TPA: c-type cytochrome [Candidatus Accumulibacter phosphatis]|nr:MAG: Cytochrome c4 precursor [Candidatus Accumulibacter sp. SK-11]HAY26367.1 cytochrome C [Accumulibacter sp.]HRL76472.1 c-type cytochrome [Candidatus Accumulibacter phosphatis]HCN69764.1 cytochrome C [Accumulibacter sp.]HCV13265.1 cytochrome C [Accumulibacter sp.]